MLKKLELFWQIFEKYSNLNFHDYPAVETKLYHADGETDRQT